MFVATGHHIPVRTIRLHEVGVSDGFRITSDTTPHQQDQPLASANQGKTGQIVRESATSRNQESGVTGDGTDKESVS